MAEVELANPKELEEATSDPFTQRVALITAVYAVALAITSLGGGNAMKEMLSAQQEASDQWAFYQAKNSREFMSQSEQKLVQAEILERGDTMKPAARQAYESLVKDLADKATQYAKDKSDIKARAEAHEKERDINRAKDPYFDYAEVLLQISIVMASIAILSKSRYVFFFSLILAVIGAFLSYNGFSLHFHIPFLDVRSAAPH